MSTWTSAFDLTLYLSTALTFRTRGTFSVNTATSPRLIASYQDG